MTLNEYCKEKGLSSYHELIAVSGKSRETLTNWMNSERNKKLLDALIELALIKKNCVPVPIIELEKLELERCNLLETVDIYSSSTRQIWLVANTRNWQTIKNMQKQIGVIESEMIDDHSYQVLKNIDREAI